MENNYDELYGISGTEQSPEQGSELPPYTDSAEKVFFDDTDFQDYDTDRHYRGKALSVTAFVLSLAAIVSACLGSILLLIGLCAAAVICGGIAAARRHSELGFAWGGIIIAVLTIVVFVWAYFGGFSLFRSYMHETNSYSSTPDEVRVYPQKEADIRGLICAPEGGVYYVRT